MAAQGGAGTVRGGPLRFLPLAFSEVPTGCGTGVLLSGIADFPKVGDVVYS